MGGILGCGLGRRGSLLGIARRLCAAVTAALAGGGPRLRRRVGGLAGVLSLAGSFGLAPLVPDVFVEEIHVRRRRLL